MMISFRIEGNVVPWSVKTDGRGHIIPDPRARAWKAKARAHAQRALGLARRAGLTWSLTEAYRVEVYVVRETWQRFDADRALNSCLDALTGVLYEDDRTRFVRSARIDVGEPVRGGAFTAILVTAMMPAELAAHDALRAKVASEWRET